MFRRSEVSKLIDFENEEDNPPVCLFFRFCTIPADDVQRLFDLFIFHPDDQGGISPAQETTR